MSNTGRQWFALRIEAIPQAVEAIEFVLNSLDALGTAMDLMKLPRDSVVVVGYFEQMPDEWSIQTELCYGLESYGFSSDAIVSVERGFVPNADWLAEWKKHWKPTRVGRFVIAPPWTDVNDHDGILIRIDPNMAFGTGTHETTQLCLRAISEHFRPGESFIDLGTGTGILAIAVARLTSRMPDCSVVGYDLDPDAVAIARENAQLNHVADLITFEAGTVTDETPVGDFVCANLAADVIVPILPTLIRKSRRVLVLSGILTEQAPEVVSVLRRNGVNDPVTECAGEWAAIIIKEL